MPKKKKAASKSVASKRSAVRAPTKSKSVRPKAMKAAAKTAKTKTGAPLSKAKSVTKVKSAAYKAKVAGAGKHAAKPGSSAAMAAKRKPDLAKSKAAGPSKPVGKKPAVSVVVSKPAPAVAATASRHMPFRNMAAPMGAVPSVAKSVPAAIAKSTAQRISAHVAPKAMPVRIVDPRTQMMAAAAAKKPVSARHGFKTNEFIVYPAHGVGRIVGIEEQEIAGMALELFVITFEKDKMTLRVPTGKLQSVGMRKLADESIVKRAMETLKGRARIKRTMWSRRAQEYEAKINSGDLISIAEVVRDLYRSDTQPEQSYSERQLYEAALDRMAREIAAVDKLDERGAVQRIVEVLSKSAKGRRVAEETLRAEEADAEFKAA